MAIPGQTFVIETIASTGADHASLRSFCFNFNSSSLDLVTDGTVAVGIVDSFVDTGGRADFQNWTTDPDNIIIVTIPISLPLDSGADTFTQGEIITGGTSGAKAMVIDQDTAYHGVGGANTLIISFIDGEFSDGETVTGGTSAATGTVNGSIDQSLYHGGVSRDVNGGTGYQIDGQDSVSFGPIQQQEGAEYARFFGLEAKRGTGGSGSGFNQLAGLSTTVNDQASQYWNCICHNGAGAGFSLAITKSLSVNCISYRNGSDGFRGTNSTSVPNDAYFCTAYANGREGIRTHRGVVQNCACGDNVSGDYNGSNTNQDYCISSDATVAGANSKSNVTFTTSTSTTGAIFTNLTDGSENFTPLEATGAATQELANAGIAVAAYEADIALNLRSDPPEIGAFEIAAAAPPTARRIFNIS